MFASVDDVKRVVGIDRDDETRDGEIAAALEAAESWVERRLRTRFDGGSQTARFFRVRSDGVIRLPVDVATVTSVVSATDGRAIPFRVVGPNRVRLGGTSAWIGEWDPTRHARTFYYEEVDVAFTSTAEVPAAVREATALIAATLVPNAPELDAEGNPVPRMLSERIGDYQYRIDENSISAGVAGNRQQHAVRLLKPFLRRGVAVV